jgi:hypothetical protein
MLVLGLLTVTTASLAAEPPLAADKSVGKLEGVFPMERLAPDERKGCLAP